MPLSKWLDRVTCGDCIDETHAANANRRLEQALRYRQPSLAI